MQINPLFPLHQELKAIRIGLELLLNHLLGEDVDLLSSVNGYDELAKLRHESIEPLGEDAITDSPSIEEAALYDEISQNEADEGESDEKFIQSAYDQARKKWTEMASKRSDREVETETERDKMGRP